MNSTPAPNPQSGPQQAIQEALALHRQGKFDLAMQRYVAVLQKDPQNLDALYYVAVLALQEGQIAEGLKVIQRAIDVGPPQARLHNLMGQGHLRLNQDDDALACFGRAIDCDANYVDASGNRATLLAEMGRPAEALADFDRAMALRPDNAEDLSNRASVLVDLGRLDEALVGFDRAIALMPKLAPAYFNRADVLMKLGRLNVALANYDRAIALYPGMAPAHSNRGVTLKALGRLDEARASIEHALSLDPKFAQAHVNRGNVAYQQGRFDDAQADYARALEAQPDFAEAKHGRALVCLSEGDWATGFRLYEDRGKLKTPVYRTLPYPRWSWEPVAGERLVLVCEQGLGDMIHFSRFAPVLAERGVDVTLLAPEPMRRLLSTLEGVTVVGFEDAPPTNGHPVRWLPLMSAPGALDIRPNSIPSLVPYLAADPARVENWGAWLGREGFKIGINWSAGAPDWFSRRRDLPLEMFAPLLDIAGVRLISLQKGAPVEQIGRVPFGRRIEQPGGDFDSGADAFLDTAAMMMNLDLVITCDTSIAHLAGALARPVFTALPYVADWRWLRDRDDTPWYPTMRLFRQSKARDWSDVFASIAKAVADMAKASPQHR